MYLPTVNEWTINNRQYAKISDHEFMILVMSFSIYKRTLNGVHNFLSLLVDPSVTFLSLCFSTTTLPNKITKFD